MLDDLLTNAVVDTILREAKAGEHLVKSLRGLSVLMFTDMGEAIDFACDVRDRFAKNNLPVSIGIDYGALLVFQESGYQDLAGDPVNIASKLSEDAGQSGCVKVSARAMELLPTKPSNGQPFNLEISNVSISGYVLS